MAVLRVDRPTIMDSMEVEEKIFDKLMAAHEVYFVRCESFVKIGFSRWSAERRMADFDTGNPFPLHLLATIPGSKRLESELHKRFADLHHVREWFRYEGELALYIAQIQKDEPYLDRVRRIDPSTGAITVFTPSPPRFASIAEYYDYMGDDA